jgi:hypothetical protein
MERNSTQTTTETGRGGEGYHRQGAAEGGRSSGRSSLSRRDPLKPLREVLERVVELAQQAVTTTLMFERLLQHSPTMWPVKSLGFADFSVTYSCRKFKLPYELVQTWPCTYYVLCFLLYNCIAFFAKTAKNISPTFRYL